MSFIALIDCNNFFVSCERVFNPKLNKRPVAVLSNNDGCIIARSQEVKALGIPMGGALFEWKELCERNKVYLTSSNFSLYGDLSRRVMETLESDFTDVEIYSIDEAFVHLQGDVEKQAQEIQKKILAWVGIPVSIGIGPTKTLAKMASHFAKNKPYLKGIYSPKQEEREQLLKTFPLENVWGIGRRLARRLAGFGIFTAWQLCQQPDLWIRKNLSVVGLRTVWELRGKPALGLIEEEKEKKSIMSSRSFGIPVRSLTALKEALSTYCARAAEKMRAQNSCAHWLTVYLKSREIGGQSKTVELPSSCAYTPLLVANAHKLLEALYSPSLSYKKAGILLSGLSSAQIQQIDFLNPDATPKQKKFQETLDILNQRFGKETAFFASQGIQREWSARRDFCSPRFTTRWDELLTIEI